MRHNHATVVLARQTLVKHHQLDERRHSTLTTLEHIIRAGHVLVELKIVVDNFLIKELLTKVVSNNLW